MLGVSGRGFVRVPARWLILFLCRGCGFGLWSQCAPQLSYRVFRSDVVLYGELQRAFRLFEGPLASGGFLRTSALQPLTGPWDRTKSASMPVPDGQQLKIRKFIRST
ncbi:hypothetical protein UK12_29260 [Saccharothrix sp. ST-888]|nr:hypothetical protein UK12_29260 [Saccharothrix sp. ST-888]